MDFYFKMTWWTLLIIVHHEPFCEFSFKLSSHEGFWRGVTISFCTVCLQVYWNIVLIHFQNCFTWVTSCKYYMISFAMAGLVMTLLNRENKQKRCRQLRCFCLVCALIDFTIIQRMCNDVEKQIHFAFYWNRMFSHVRRVYWVVSQDSSSPPKRVFRL